MRTCLDRNNSDHSVQTNAPYNFRPPDRIISELGTTLFIFASKTYALKETYDLRIPEEFIHRLDDAFEGTRSKSVYGTDAKLLPNSRLNRLRTPIT